MLMHFSKNTFQEERELVEYRASAQFLLRAEQQQITLVFQSSGYVTMVRYCWKWKLIVHVAYLSEPSKQARSPPVVTAFDSVSMQKTPSRKWTASSATAKLFNSCGQFVMKLYVPLSRAHTVTT
eukprot:2200683-Amphidinium_carterae.1